MPHAATQRCRPLFDQVLAETLNVDEFYRGVITAYCEKLILGACNACMLRPNPSHRETVVSLLDSLSEHYPIRHVAIDDELWFGLDVVIQHSVATWQGLKKNSPEWHSARGHAVGIPSYMIDSEYHTR